MSEAHEIHLILQSHPYAFSDGLRALLGALRGMEHLHLIRRVASSIDGGKLNPQHFAKAAMVVGFFEAPLGRDIMKSMPSTCQLVRLIPADDDLPVATIDVNDDAIARMGVSYFESRQFRNIAFAGFWSHMSVRRRLAFHAAEVAPSVQRFDLASVYGGDLPEYPVWERDHNTLVAWLNSLPKPVGIFCCNDQAAQQLIDLALDAGLRVPEDVSVLGVDDDEFHCEFGRVRLSSIDPDRPRVGAIAAKLILDWVRDGVAPEPRPYLVQPRSIVERRSTDFLSAEDPDILAALTFIRDNIQSRIGSGEVAQHVAMSRRALERRFLAAIGKPPGAIIRELRCERAHKLLMETDFKLEEIARRTGYLSRTHLVSVIQRRFGKSPGALRKARAMG
jgi:LacI family transcriptional regulator